MFRKNLSFCENAWIYNKFKTKFIRHDKKSMLNNGYYNFFIPPYYFSALLEARRSSGFGWVMYIELGGYFAIVI